MSIGVSVESNAVRVHGFGLWSLGFLDCSGGFVVRFWLTNLGSEGFEVQFA